MKVIDQSAMFNFLCNYRFRENW